MTSRDSNPSDHVHDPSRRDKRRADKIAAMRRLIDEAEASGVSPNSVADILAAARREAAPDL